MKLVFLLMAACLSVVSGDDICALTHNNNQNTDLKIQLPKEFSVDIEVVKQNRVVNMKMHYSAANKIIRMDIVDKMLKTVKFFDFNDDVNEILTFTYYPKTPRGVCQVSDLRKSTDPFLLGGVSQNKKNISTILDPLVAIHFKGLSGFRDEEIFQDYNGKSMVRDKEASLFSSCQKWVNLVLDTDAVVSVTHGFAATRGDNVKWPGDKYTTVIPLYMAIEASGKINGDTYTKTVPFVQSYNFFNFKSGFEDFNVLETPEGVVCHGRKTTKEMPKLPPFIHYTSETIDYKDKLMFYVEEIYDYESQYGIVKTIPFDDAKSTVPRLTTVLDYADDRAYTIDTFSGACGITTVNNAIVTDVMTVRTGGKGEMMNPEHYFRADVKDFSYLGKKKVRGMLCDTFVAQSTDYKDQSQAVVQWQFAPETSSWNDKVSDTLKTVVPVKMKMWSNETNAAPVVQNIFHVDYTRLRPDFVDLSTCFKKQRHFQLVAKGAALKLVIDKFDVASFKYKVVANIAGIAGISWSQINRIQVLPIGSDLTIEFFIGDEERLDDVTKKVTSAVKNGELIVGLDDIGKNFLPINEVSSAFLNEGTHSDSGDEGYSDGAMAGLGISMIIVGLVGGAGIGFAHTKFF